MTDPRIRSTTPGGLAGEGGAVPVRAPGFVSPPRGSVLLDKAYGPRTIMPADGMAPIWPADGTELEVPAACQLRISGIGFDAIDPTALVFSYFSIRVNGQPQRGYERQPVAIGRCNNPGAVTLHVAGPAVVTLFMENGFPLMNWNYTARLVGWIYQEVET